ncbi:MAG: riboflavin synthase [Mariprofundaceae bacterium]
MFTGIVQGVGQICAISKERHQSEFVFSTALDCSTWKEGDSISVDGCCLTISSFPEADQFAAILSPETLKCTCFDKARIGMSVNLEPALCVGDVLGGHFLTGHIDATATVKSVHKAGEHCEVEFELPASLSRYVVAKGSIAMNGVSLTVNEVHDNCFTVNLIPHTLTHTSLDSLSSGHKVNIETDIIGRYVERLLHGHLQEDHESGKL